LKIRLNVNGEDREFEATVKTSLNEALHDILSLTSVKRGCDSGGCGMCTVLVDDDPVFSCMTPVWKAEGRRVTTVEGMMEDGQLHPLQDSFIKHSAAQCGYCTSAMLLVAKSLLQHNPNPTNHEIRSALCGVICRCTGYLPYIEAIADAAGNGRRTEQVA